MTLPPQGIQSIVLPARELLSNGSAVLRSTIPISGDAWLNGLAEAGITRQTDPLQEEIDRLFNSTGADDAKGIRVNSLALASKTQDMCSDLGILTACECASDGRTWNAIKSLRALASLALDGLTDDASKACMAPARLRAKTAIDALFADSSCFQDEPCRAVFGVTRDEVCGDDGTFSESRLYGHYYGNYAELVGKVSKILSAFTDHPPPLDGGLMSAWVLIHADYPLTMFRTAVFSTEQIKTGFAANPIDSGKALRAYKLRVDKSKANHAGIIRTQRASSESSTDTERAELTLDLYRRVMEGQFRPWAWTLLRIRGRTGTKLPELSTLRDCLFADGHRVLATAGEAILPAARNAAAHEDFLWDDAQELINVGDEFISIDDLETSIRLAYAFMCGCECAIIQCKADDASLVEAMNLEDPPGGFATRSIIDAANLFGTNGLRVRSYALNRGVFSLEIDDWGPDAVNPGLQAITVASQVLSRAHRIQISIGDSATLAADVETAQVQKNLPVWLMARTLFTEMPPSTFLPTNAAIRTAVESSTQAAQAVTWLALNDALHVFEDIADASDDRRLLRRMWSQFQGRLALASYALQISEEVVGPGDERTIAAKLALKKASLETSKPPKEIVQKFLISLGKNVEKFWHDLGPVPVLPTVDKTPLE